MVWHSLHRLMWKTHRRPLAWSWLGSCAWAENFRESVRKEKWSGQQMKKSEHRLREPLEECCVPRSYYHCTFLGYHIVKDKSLLTICVCAFLQHIFKNILIVICITLWRNNCAARNSKCVRKHGQKRNSGKKNQEICLKSLWEATLWMTLKV